VRFYSIDFPLPLLNAPTARADRQPTSLWPEDRRYELSAILAEQRARKRFGS